MIEFETEKRCCVGDWQSMAINDDASSVKEKTIIVRQYVNRQAYICLKRSDDLKCRTQKRVLEEIKRCRRSNIGLRVYE